MNRLKNFLPSHIWQVIYNSLVLPRFNYGLLLWGHKLERLSKIQKKIVRIINHSKYNSHTDPIFKSRNLLKLEDIYVSQVLTFFYKLENNRIPVYFSCIQYVPNTQVHDYETRRKELYVPRSDHTFAKKKFYDMNWYVF